MATAPQSRAFPRYPLIGAGALMLLTIVGASLAPRETNPPTAAPLIVRDLRFEDRTDGAVAIYDADANRQIAVLAPGTNGFVRATLRGFARERRREDQGPEVPFRLTGWADGRLTLEDPTTGRRADMEAFGIDNERAFAQLLTAGRGRP